MAPNKPEVFISHVPEDASLARVVAGMLERSGLRTSLVQPDVHDDKSWDEYAERLRRADMYLLLVTPAYLGSDSLVNFELGVALARVAHMSSKYNLVVLTSGVSKREIPAVLRDFPAFSLDQNDPADALETALRQSA